MPESSPKAFHTGRLKAVRDLMRGFQGLAGIQGPSFLAVITEDLHVLWSPIWRVGKSQPSISVPMVKR